MASTSSSRPIVARTLPTVLRRVLRLSLLGCLAAVIQCREAPRATSLLSVSDAGVAGKSVAVARSGLEALAASDPLAFIEECRRRCEASVLSYRCLFLKQERISGELGPEQEIEIQFRESPFSVHMKWIKNPGGAVEATYIAGKWKDENGAEMASFRPSGVISLLVSEIKLDIHGEQATKDSRRTLDQFGFKNTLDLILKYSRMAEGDPQFRLAYTGPGSLDGRATFTFERTLPYTGVDGVYPDRILVLHVDQEWLLPTACLTYADDARGELLGSYVFTDVRLNAPVSAETFDALASAAE